MRLFKNKKRIVVLIDEHGKVLEKPILCPKCNKKVFLVNRTTVHCKRCGTLDIKELVDLLFIEYTRQLAFTESN